MLSKLRIRNFKCLQDTGELTIRPLTFLVGPNSSGKSSVFQLLAVLRRTLESTDTESPLATKEVLGAYPDFVFRHEIERELGVMLEFPPVGRIPGPTEFEEVVRYDPQTTQIRLRRSVVRVAGRFVQALQEIEGRYEAHVRLLAGGETLEARVQDVQPGKFFDFSGGRMDAETVEKLKRLNAALEVPPPDFFFRWNLATFFRLESLRDAPKRSHVMSGEVLAHVGARGERAVDALWAAARSTGSAERGLVEKTTAWLRQLGIADRLRLDAWEESNQFRVLITDPATGVEVNLADVGFGASQVLPVVVEVFLAKPGSVVLVEQPEIHLHPRAQADLGDLLLAAVSSRDRTFMVETHSEHILARVRRRIAEERLPKDDVAIYYFEPTPDGTRVREVTLNDDGQYVDFPEGFFEEDFQEAMLHLEAMGRHAASREP